jgi:GPH family glycoside/pentoside/hexuronide:cation symporter
LQRRQRCEQYPEGLLREAWIVTGDGPKLLEKLSYGCGDFASVLYWQTFMVFLLIFYTDVFGITAAAAGTMILVSRLWDGVNDPMAGILADRTKTRWGKFRPYLLWFCVPFAVMGVLTFTTPDLSATGKLIWAYATFLPLMMLYTIINIPYTAMLGVISPDPIARTGISAVKFLFAYSAGTVLSATLLPLVQFFGKGDEAKGWQLSFVVYGVVATALFLVTFAGTRERVSPPPAQKTPISRDLRDLFSNRPWVILLPMTLLFILYVAVRLSATAHYFKYYVGTQQVAVPLLSGSYGYEALLTAYTTIGQVVGILGVLAVTWLARLIGKKQAFVILYVVGIVSTAAFYVVGPEQVLILFLLQIIGSITGAPLSVLVWAMYADTADYGEWTKGRRATGLVFSASTMSQKFGWAVGIFIAGWLLEAVGFKANVEQSDEVKQGLVLLMSLIPAGLGVLSLIPLYFYRLDEKTMSTIAAELEARRTAAPAGS